MKSEQRSAAELAVKKKKRLRFAGLVVLTVLVIAAVIITALCVKSCEEKVNLDIGQPYDAGKAVVTVKDIKIERLAAMENVYAIITLEVQAEKDFTLDPFDFELDGVSPLTLRTSDDTTIDTEKKEIAAGTTEEVKLAFFVPRSMNVSFLTYKKAVIRLGSMIESENNL